MTNNWERAAQLFKIKLFSESKLTRGKYLYESVYKTRFRLGYTYKISEKYS